MRRRLGFPRSFDTCDRQRFQAGLFLGRKQQPSIDFAELDFLIVAAAAFIGDRQIHFEIPGLGGATPRDVRSAEHDLGDRQHHRHFGLLLKSLFQIDAVGLAAGIEHDHRPILHPRMQVSDLDLIIGQCLLAQFQRMDAIVIVVLPALRGLKQFTPISVRRLKMLRAQEHSFGPMHRQISHEHSDQDYRATFLLLS